MTHSRSKAAAASSSSGNCSHSWGTEKKRFTQYALLVWQHKKINAMCWRLLRSSDELIDDAMQIKFKVRMDSSSTNKQNTMDAYYNIYLYIFIYICLVGVPRGRAEWWRTRACCVLLPLVRHPEHASAYDPNQNMHHSYFSIAQCVVARIIESEKCIYPTLHFLYVVCKPLTVGPVDEPAQAAADLGHVIGDRAHLGVVAQAERNKGSNWKHCYHFQLSKFDTVWCFQARVSLHRPTSILEDSMTSTGRAPETTSS